VGFVDLDYSADFDRQINDLAQIVKVEIEPAAQSAAIPVEIIRQAEFVSRYRQTRTFPPQSNTVTR
jgi:hypothetical protein